MSPPCQVAPVSRTLEHSSRHDCEKNNVAVGLLGGQPIGSQKAKQRNKKKHLLNTCKEMQSLFIFLLAMLLAITVSIIRLLCASSSMATAAVHGTITTPALANLPYCSLDSTSDADALKSAVWIDPQLSSSIQSDTFIHRPRSNDLDKQLEEEIWKDQGDETRLRRIARLVLDTRGHCRLAEWDPMNFENCLAGRRIIIVGDSMSVQMTESLSYMLNLKDGWKREDGHAPELGKCRHCIDAVTSNGLHIIGRAMFHSDSDDKTPLKFGIDAWNAMVLSIGGWKEGDILVVNFGAHYMPNLMDLRIDLKILFYDALAKIPSDKVTIFWREYAPAHFQAFPDGEYPPSHMVKFKGELACVPHLSGHYTQSIVQHHVQWIMDECGSYCAHIRRIPVWDLLRNAWDQHTEGSHCFDDEWCDCRHYAIPGPMEYANILLYNQICISPAPPSSSS